MFRIGQSSDIHPLAEGRKLILGGVEIEHTKGLLGHSDADALTHAVAESILGRWRWAIWAVISRTAIPVTKAPVRWICCPASMRRCAQKAIASAMWTRW